MAGDQRHGGGAGGREVGARRAVERRAPPPPRTLPAEARAAAAEANATRAERAAAALAAEMAGLAREWRDTMRRRRRWWRCMGRDGLCAQHMLGSCYGFMARRVRSTPRPRGHVEATPCGWRRGTGRRPPCTPRPPPV